jgi:hypothetical protein
MTYFVVPAGQRVVENARLMALVVFFTHMYRLPTMRGPTAFAGAAAATPADATMAPLAIMTSARVERVLVVATGPPEIGVGVRERTPTSRRRCGSWGVHISTCHRRNWRSLEPRERQG